MKKSSILEIRHGHLTGPRPAEQIREYTWQLVNFLLTKDVKMIVIACNTATAVVWEEIKAQLDIPVLGVILPGASAAIKSSQGGKIGVIGTPMTVQSDIYRQKIHDLDPDLQVDEFGLSQVCSLGGVWCSVNQCHQESGL